MQTPDNAFPIVVPLGFAGARHLLAPGVVLTLAQQANYVATLKQHLTEALKKLPAELGLGARHILCGVSQVAIGADEIFTRVCAELNLPQRILLPQPRDAYLAAQSPSGVADFDAQQRAETSALFGSPHIVQERVVSDSSDRETRFVDTNLEIIRESEVFVCLLKADTHGRSGGTMELLDKARRRGHPVLEIRVGVESGAAVLSETRHNWPNQDRINWRPPELPAELMAKSAQLESPTQPLDVFVSAQDTLAYLARLGTDQASLQRSVFRNAALCIITAHLLATVCAVLVLKLQSSPLLIVWLVALLAVESLLLLTGLSIHLWLHRARAVKSWATFRLAVELSVSATAMRGVQVSLDHLFTLPFPNTLQPLLRTIHLLHLVLSRRVDSSWQTRRDVYFEERLDGERGQIGYYARELAKAKRRLSIANWSFLAATVLALVTALSKVAFSAAGIDVAVQFGGAVSMATTLIAVVFPMLAVAALSLAASFDLEARVHTYEDTLSDVLRLKALMQEADSEREFSRFALQAERELLAETANWASRRSFTSVT